MLASQPPKSCWMLLGEEMGKRYSIYGDESNCSQLVQWKHSVCSSFLKLIPACTAYGHWCVCFFVFFLHYVHHIGFVQDWVPTLWENINITKRVILHAKLLLMQNVHNYSIWVILLSCCKYMGLINERMHVEPQLALQRKITTKPEQPKWNHGLHR